MTKFLRLGLATGLLLISLAIPAVVGADGPGESQTRGEGQVIGLASTALRCLSLGSSHYGQSSGLVRLNWQGQIDRARLVVRVAGAEAAHPIKVNGQTAALTPIQPEGATCGQGEIFYVDIAPEAVVQGDNLIEITDDTLPGDAWAVSNVMLQVFGPILAVAPDSTPALGATGVSALGASEFIFTFTNPYDGSTQEFMAWVPLSYTTPAPLLIYLHGRNSDMAEGRAFSPTTDLNGWLLASPELHGSWPGPTPPPPIPPGKYAYASLESQYDVIGTVNYMIDNYNVDLNRIYLYGSSMGTQVGLVTVGKFPHVFAGHFGNKGPSNFTEWYDEQVAYYGDENKPQVEWMRQECHSGGTPKYPNENPFCYQRRSGLRFSRNFIHTPISMTHSLSDALVSIHHSTDMGGAINSFGPDQPASVFVDTVVGPTCGDPYHCYKPDPQDVLDYLAPISLDKTPTHVNFATDESKSYYWLNVVQSGGDHWAQVEATADVAAKSVTATISDANPLTLGINFGSTALPSSDVNPQLLQPGLGLPATTYLVVENSQPGPLVNYISGYFTTTLSSTGQFDLTISAIGVAVSADPSTVEGGQPSTSTISAIVRDQLGNPVPNTTPVGFVTSEGTFSESGSANYVTTPTNGQANATLSLNSTADAAQITVTVGTVSGVTTVNIVTEPPPSLPIYLPLVING
jgi:hypothetical protein